MAFASVSITPPMVAGRLQHAPGRRNDVEKLNTPRGRTCKRSDVTFRAQTAAGSSGACTLHHAAPEHECYAECYAVTRVLPRCARAEWGLPEWGQRLFDRLPNTDGLMEAGICHYLFVWVSHTGGEIVTFEFLPVFQDEDAEKVECTIASLRKHVDARKEKATFPGWVREERVACLPASAIRVGRTALSRVGLETSKPRFYQSFLSFIPGLFFLELSFFLDLLSFLLEL